MFRGAARKLVFLALLAAAAWLNIDYWRDPVYWRRWWDTLTHLEPDYLNLSPTVVIQSGRSAFLPAASADELTIDPEALHRAEQYAAEFDSFALIVVHEGAVQTEWYSQAWRRDKQAQSQSMMKTVTAIMAGLAIADGHIASVEDPIGLYLQEWQDDPRGKITLANLMQMSSGLATYEFSLNPFRRDTAFRFLFSADREAVALSTKLAWTPGSRFEYNDINAQLAGILIERAVGQDYVDYLRERLWDPLGGQYSEIWLDRPDGNAMTACCFLAAPIDWAKIGVMLKDQGLFNGRQVVPAQWVADMLSPSVQQTAYGYFTWLGAGSDAVPSVSPNELAYSEPFASDDLFMLLGHGGQRVYVSRSDDLVIVRQGPFHGIQPLKDGWDNSRLPNMLRAGILRD